MIPNDTKQEILNDYITGKTFKVALLTSSHTNDPDTQTYFSDVIANEVSGSGYTTGGVALANVTAVVDDVTDTAYIDADNTVFSTVTLTAEYYCVYESTGNNATSRILAIKAFSGGAKSPFGDNLTITWAADGLVKLV